MSHDMAQVILIVEMFSFDEIGFGLKTRTIISEEVLVTQQKITEDLILLKQQLLIEKDHVLTDIMFQVLENGVK